MKKIYISDYTLRQSAVNGSAVSFREKTSIAKCLDELGVDAIELSAIKCYTRSSSNGWLVYRSFAI